MINQLKQLFGLTPAPDFKQLAQEGAIIVDVRSRSEFNGGHIKGAINIPVDMLANNLDKLRDKQRTVITCCASGMRSGIAKNVLKTNGYAAVHNGGSWISLQQKLG